MGHTPAQAPLTKIYFSYAVGLHRQFPAQSFQNPWVFLRDKSGGSSTKGDRAPSSPLKHPGPLSQADEPGLPWQHPARPLLSPAARRQQVVPSCLRVNPCAKGPWTPFQVGISAHHHGHTAWTLAGDEDRNGPCALSPSVRDKVKPALRQLETLRSRSQEALAKAGTDG